LVAVHSTKAELADLPNTARRVSSAEQVKQAYSSRSWDFPVVLGDCLAAQQRIRQAQSCACRARPLHDVTHTPPGNGSWQHGCGSSASCGRRQSNCRILQHRLAEPEYMACGKKKRHTKRPRSSEGANDAPALATYCWDVADGRAEHLSANSSYNCSQRWISRIGLHALWRDAIVVARPQKMRSGRPRTTAVRACLVPDESGEHWKNIRVTRVSHPIRRSPCLRCAKA